MLITNNEILNKMLITRLSSLYEDIVFLCSSNIEPQLEQKCIEFTNSCEILLKELKENLSNN